MKELKEKILNENFIESVNKISKEKSGGDINICFPKSGTEQDKLHFLLNTDEIISLFDVSKITAFISDNLKCENITVQLKKSFKEGSLENLFENITPYRVDNLSEIKNILEKYDLEKISKSKTDEDESMEENHQPSFWNAKKENKVRLYLTYKEALEYEKKCNVEAYNSCGEDDPFKAIKIEEKEATETDKKNIAYCKKKHNMPDAEEHVYIIKIYFEEELPVTSSVFKLYLGGTKAQSCQIDKYAGFEDETGQGVCFKLFNPYELKEYGDKPIAIKWPSDEKRRISKFTINDAIKPVLPKLDKPTIITSPFNFFDNKVDESQIMEKNYQLSFWSPNNEKIKNDDGVNSLKELFIKNYSEKLKKLSENEKITFLKEIAKILGVVLENENIKIITKF